MNDCDNFREMYEAYALGALDAEDRAAFQKHLATRCATCIEAVQGARWTVSQLAYTAPQAEPPASLRRKIREAAGIVAAKPEQPRTSWFPVWGWAAVAALVLLAVFSTFQMRRMQQDAVALQTQIQQQEESRAKLVADREMYQRTLAILSAADTREVNLKASEKPDMPEVHAYWSSRLGLVLAAQKVPMPAADRALQLWVVPKTGSPVSAGVFRPDPAGGVMMLSSPMAEIASAAALAITDEPSAGSAQPTTKPIWVGPVPDPAAGK